MDTELKKVDVKTFEDYLSYIAEAFVPGRRLEAVGGFIATAYKKYDRKYYDLGYLMRVLHALDTLIANELEELSRPEVEDAFTTAFFHRFFMARRRSENANATGQTAKYILEQEYYPRIQRVASFVTLTDVLHFPESSSYGKIVSLVRDAIVAELATHPDKNIQRSLTRMRRDCCWDANTAFKILTPLYEGWLKEPPFVSPAAVDFWGDALKSRLKQYVYHLKPESDVY
jgi:hypothetical protein